jgi:hypothetical protein
MKHLAVLVGSLILVPLAWAGPAGVPKVVEEVRREVTKKNTDPGGRPLPVVSHWANGFGRANFSSDYQIGLLEQGHHVLPTLPFPRPGATRYPEDGKPWVEKLARWKAPFSMRAGQWEQVLVDKKQPVSEPGKWRNLPPEKSPLVIGLDGKVVNWISPWGAIEPWYEAGVYNTHSGAFEELQRWYPDPPLVILLSNNEARKLKPKQEIEKLSKRYVDRHGRGRPGSYLRKQMAEGYIKRYRALLKGIRAGLTAKAWKENSLLVGYGCFGPPHFGRMSNWDIYSFASEDRISPWHLVWEGGSPSYYTHNWNASTDYRVWSPQVEANNWVFMLEEAYRESPNFWFELSIWDGNPARSKKSTAKRKKDEYLAAGQSWTPARYAGFVQYGLWLLQPRVVREFRGSTVPRAEFHEDFEALIAGVDRVWHDPVLTRFWRDSKLVPNRSRKHPYQTRIPKRWKEVDRWYLLNTNLDPAGAWQLDTEIPVFSLARVRGDKGEREYLIYTHSPVKERDKVEIEVPGYGKVRVKVTPGGNFYHVREGERSVRAIEDPK